MEAISNFLSNSTIGGLLPVIVLLLLMYILILRPSMKQNKESRNNLDTMEIGDEVMTAGGFYGLVYAIDDENVVLEMLPDYNKLMIKKTSIVRFITAEAARAEAGDTGRKGFFGRKSEPVAEIEEPEDVVAEEVEEA